MTESLKLPKNKKLKRKFARCVSIRLVLVLSNCSENGGCGTETILDNIQQIGNSGMDYQPQPYYNSNNGNEKLFYQYL